MKIKNTLFLHIAMAVLAVLFLCAHPLITSLPPTLRFQPLIKTMEGTQKEQREKIATLSHTLQGNAIFFLGASEVATSEHEHFAAYNFFNQQLHQPLVAYGDSYVDNVTQYSLLSRFKNDINSNSKIVLLLAPDSFYFDGIPPAIFADHFPAPIFNPLMADLSVRPYLVHYLHHIHEDEISHLTFAQMKIYGWHPALIWQEISYQFANFCDLIKNDWLALLNLTPNDARPWPAPGPAQTVIDWDQQLAHARQLNQIRHESAATLWMDQAVFHEMKTADEWYTTPIEPQEMQAFRQMIAMLKARHAQVAVIIDPLNPWALKHTQRFQAVNDQITATLKENQIPYLDMYASPYQNGWNWDRLHPTELAWVAMDRFIAENFKR